MDFLWRRASLLALVALLLSGSILMAQDTSNPDATNEETPADTQETETTAAETSDITLTAAGSGIVLPVLETIISNSDTGITFDMNITGTNAGLEAFCGGDVALAAASRPMSVDEEARCTSNNITYAELLVGMHVLTFVANPEADLNTCLTSSDINQLFAPAATLTNLTDAAIYLGPIETVEQAIEDATSPEDTPEATPEATPEVTTPVSIPLTILVPPDDTLTFLALDETVAGTGVRRDAQVMPVADILQTVANTPGAVGVVDLQTLNDSDADVLVFDVNFPQMQDMGCMNPSIPTAEQGLYGGTYRFFFYVNTDQLDTLDDLLSVLGDAQTGSAIIRDSGLTPPSQVAFLDNSAALAGDIGRTFTADVSGFEVPETLIGGISIGGAANTYQLLQSTITNFEQNQPSLTIETYIEGEQAGIRRLCNGELDVVMAYDAMLTESQQVACEANDITLYDIPLGAQAAVLLVNEANTQAVCLSTDQIAEIWGAPSTDTVQNWQDVDETFDDLEMTLFGISPGNVLSDLLMLSAEGPVLPVRADTEQDADPLYRAAATANVPGGITYMSWSDYQRVQSRAQERVQLVSVSSGDSDCTVPSEETILNGTYPLSRQATLLIPRRALANINVQSFLWQTFDPGNFGGISSAAFVGIDFGNFMTIRDELEFDFALVEDELANANTATPDTTDETTQEPDETTSDDASNTDAEATPEATTEADTGTENN